MMLLITGLTAFFSVHLISTFKGVRSRFVSRLGERKYKLLFSLASIIGLAMIIVGYQSASGPVLYSLSEAARNVTIVLMYFSVYFFISNSAGPAPSSAQYFTAYPLNIGVILWAASHLLVTGRLEAVLVFASFLIFSVVSIMAGRHYQLKPRLKERPPLWKEFVFMAVATVVYGGLVWGHHYYAGQALV